MPRARVADLIDAGDTVVAEWSADYGDGKVWRNVSVFKMRDGSIAEETDYFGDPFPGPEWRRDLVEIEELPKPGE